MRFLTEANTTQKVFVMLFVINPVLWIFEFHHALLNTVSPQWPKEMAIYSFFFTLLVSGICLLGFFLFKTNKPKKELDKEE